MHSRCLLLTLCLLSANFFLAAPAQARHNKTIEVRLIRSSETQTLTLPIDHKGGGISVATADLGTDGVPEIIVGNGYGNEPRVRVLRQDGSVITSFLAYAATMGMGVHVATCDVDADGMNEIVVAASRGGGPHVRVFSGEGVVKDGGGFFAYAESLRSGLNLACGNLDDEPGDELVTLPAPGGAPHVRVWKMKDGHATLHKEFFAGAQDDLRGLIGLTHDKKLLLATQKGNSAQVKTYVIHSPSTPLSEKNIPLNAYGALSLFEQNGAIKLATTNGTIVDLTTLTSAQHSAQKFSIAASADLDRDGADDLVLAPSAPILSADESPKSILVDLSDQQLYAYENGAMSDTFPISSARGKWETPVGKTQILAKIDKVRYQWSYGPGNPNNYDLGLVPYNLRIFPHIYIHYAPWHKNFGHPMSHGCVNVSLENMKRLYAWASADIPVEVRE